MTSIRLKSLVIENFRSIRGQVAVPLDAQVVLIHGANGMGKTSILSAIELGLTGKIAHLADADDKYKSYLSTLGTGGGSIMLTTTGALRGGARASGSLAFSTERFTPDPLFDSLDARFFAERCYLPQATLGRLLELYDEQKTSSTSPLTLFVKELLGLDPLDSLVDGLHSAFNVTRVRNLVPDYRRLEAFKKSLEDEIDGLDRAIAGISASTEARRVALNEKLLTINGEGAYSPVTADTDLAKVLESIESEHGRDARLSDLFSTKSELRGLLERWQALSPSDAGRDLANKERDDHFSLQALNSWRTGPGAALESAVNKARELVSEVPPLEDDLERGRLEALRRVSVEEARCDTLLKTHTSASEREKSLLAIVERVTSRLEMLDADLANSANSAKTLASALASVVPHIEGEICPVCDRDFIEMDAGSLSAHVAANIASLTTEAGRLQALATERAEESSRLIAAQRELLTARNGVLSPTEVAELTVRKAQMTDLNRHLRDLESTTRYGVGLVTAATNVRQRLILARRSEEVSITIVPEIEKAVLSATGRDVASFPNVDTALGSAILSINNQVANIRLDATLRMEARSIVDLCIQDRKDIQALSTNRQHQLTRIGDVDRALKQVELSRAQAKRVSDAAGTARSAIVKKVFSESLNKVWRDLFVRLAPSEQFVPAFRLPKDAFGKVEAVLETLHRSGQASGSPGAILSQGNLNTAALTLFLALHLSVPFRMPWLVLDDPVQSMDDVHIAQFAALLRTLSKGMGRQVIIAVHERALFDYLTLELSPAFQGDSLITVEISRNFEGATVATPHAFSYEEDSVVAA